MWARRCFQFRRRPRGALRPARTAGLRDTYELSHNLAPTRALVGLIRGANGERMLDSYRQPSEIFTWRTIPANGEAARSGGGQARGLIRVRIHSTGGAPRKRLPNSLSRDD